MTIVGFVLCVHALESVGVGKHLRNKTYLNVLRVHIASIFFPFPAEIW